MAGEPAAKSGKALVLGILTVIPVAAALMWIGLSGGGRDAKRELYWLGPLPAQPGLPPPLGQVRPGSPYEEVRDALPELLPGDPAAAPRDAVIAFEGRSLSRRLIRDVDRLRVEITSGIQTATLAFSGPMRTLQRVGFSAPCPLPLPGEWSRSGAAFPGPVPGTAVRTSTEARGALCGLRVTHANGSSTPPGGAR